MRTRVVVPALELYGPEPAQPQHLEAARIGMSADEVRTYLYSKDARAPIQALAHAPGMSEAEVRAVLYDPAELEAAASTEAFWLCTVSPSGLFATAETYRSWGRVTEEREAEVSQRIEARAQGQPARWDSMVEDVVLRRDRTAAGEES